MIRRPPRSTLDRSSAASDVYKRQLLITLTIGMLIGAIIYGMKIRVNKEDKIDIK